MGGSSILILLSALLCLLSFPPFNMGFLIFIALIPILYEVKKILISSLSKVKKARTLFIYGWIFGSIFMAGFHFWMFALKPFSSLIGIFLIWFIFSLYLGLFFGFSFSLLILFNNRYFVSTLPTLFIIGEWIRSLGPIGNPAGVLGYSLASVPYIQQLASVIGIFGLSWLILYLNLLFLELVEVATKKKNKFSFTLISLQELLPSKVFLKPILSLIFLSLFGYALTLTHNEFNPLRNLRASVVQGNHAQSEKLNQSLWNTIREDYISLVYKSVKNLPDFIFLPETITPDFNKTKYSFTEALRVSSKTNNTHILFGTPTKTNGKYFNSISVINRYGVEEKNYNKQHLMPFGEYWPFRPVFDYLKLDNLLPGADFSSDKNQTPLSLESATIGTAICLEAMYPWLLRRQVRSGASLLYVAANNAWFFKSSASEKLLQMSRFRAIENRRYLIYASNIGHSSIIDHTGKILDQVPFSMRDIIIETVKQISSISLYTRLGNWVIGIGCIYLLLLLLNKNFKLKN